MVAQLGAQVVLARLLVPADYGVFSILLLTITLAGYFSELGGAALLVKKETITSEEIRTQFTIQVLIGLLLSCLALVSAEPVTRFFSLNDAADMMVIVGLNPLIIALGIVGNRMLSRQHQFKTIQVVSLASYVFGYAFLATLLAKLGWGPWSLVAGTLAQSTMATVCYLVMARHPMKPLLNKPSMTEQFSMGFHAFLSGLLTWGLFSLDRLFVGKLFPAQIVGTYVSAFNLSVAPIWQITSSVQQQLFAKGSRTAADPAALLQSYQTAVFYVIILVAPAMQLISLSSTEIVAILLGSKWSQVAPILHVLALAMPFYVLYGVSSPFLWAKGRISLDVGLQLLTVACMLLGLYAFVNDHVLEATYVVLATYFIRAVFGVITTTFQLGGSTAQTRQMLAWLVASIVPGVLCNLLERHLEAAYGRSYALIASIALLQVILNVAIVVLQARMAGGAIGWEADRLLAYCKRIGKRGLVRTST